MQIVRHVQPLQQGVVNMKISGNYFKGMLHNMFGLHKMSIICPSARRGSFYLRQGFPRDFASFSSRFQLSSHVSFVIITVTTVMTSTPPRTVLGFETCSSFISKQIRFIIEIVVLMAPLLLCHTAAATAVAITANSSSSSSSSSSNNNNNYDIFFFRLHVHSGND